MESRMAAPEHLGAAGTALWNRIVGDLADGWELDERELHSLERACDCADTIAALEAEVERDGSVVKGTRGNPVVHPAVQEARQLRLAELRLLRSLELSDPKADETPGTRRARNAARARWGHEANWTRRKAEITARREDD